MLEFVATEKEITIIKQLTANNNHIETYIKISELLKDNKLVSAFEGVKNLQDFYGRLIPDLSKIRKDLYDKMIERVKSKIENAQDIYKSI